MRRNRFSKCNDDCLGLGYLSSFLLDIIVTFGQFGASRKVIMAGTSTQFFYNYTPLILSEFRFMLQFHSSFWMHFTV